MHVLNNLVIIADKRIKRISKPQEGFFVFVTSNPALKALKLLLDSIESPFPEIVGEVIV